CTAQVLLAVVAAMYAVYHGPDGIRRIARRVHGAAVALAAGLRALGLALDDAPFFDTLRVRTTKAQQEKVLAAARDRRLNLRAFADGNVGIALDEAITREELATLLGVFAGATGGSTPALDALETEASTAEIPAAFA